MQTDENNGAGAGARRAVAHSPLPWAVWESKTGTSFKEAFKHKRTVCFQPADTDSKVVVALCDYHTAEIAEANAAFIVKACNEHGPLVDFTAAVVVALELAAVLMPDHPINFAQFAIDARAALSPKEG